jgi:hypothetical protein
LLFLLLSCKNSPKKKEVDIKRIIADLIDGKEDFETSETYINNEFIVFKESIKIKLDDNQKIIIDLKSKMISKKKVNSIDETEINKLEKRNTELMLKVENYDVISEQELSVFKIESYNELDDLEKLISSMVNRKIKN